MRDSPEMDRVTGGGVLDMKREGEDEKESLRMRVLLWLVWVRARM